PKWIAAMQRHGYKGAFEMAATVDYLFGYDAIGRDDRRPQADLSRAGGRPRGRIVLTRVA
ncbi:MAG: cobaltochelatase subunit CobN, partial [Actinomycetota bacterium]|nr:cobaltochelatase subunit CobN [Actinomycetota bacterium]